ncbi:uncharacterized protein LOC143957994 [Lithobates pipiens]
MFLLKGANSSLAMSSGRKGKMANVASFIREQFNIVENSILVVVLVGLEKIMDLEFQCPADKPLAIVYSLAFLSIPTAIVLVVACYISRRGNSAGIEGGTEEGCVESMEMSESKTETKNPKCGCCCANIKSRFFEMKVVAVWLLIVITDGRYGDCLVTSLDELKEVKNSNITHRISLLSWTEVRNDYLTHLFQIVGLVLILLAIIVVCSCESRIYTTLPSLGRKSETQSESERRRRKNEDNVLQITENTPQEQAGAD